MIGRIKKILGKRGNCVSLLPDGSVKGRVLLSYIVEPFLTPQRQEISSTHTNFWECTQIARTFLEFGYAVDVIDWVDTAFVPRLEYSFVVDIHSNLERLAPLLDSACVKILHITGSHWLFQNQAELKRLYGVQQRRGVTLLPRRTVPPSLGIENADFATIIGNEFTMSDLSVCTEAAVSSADLRVFFISVG